jgi:hypothetical protein
MCRYDDEPFLMVYSDQESKLLNVADDLRIRKRGRRGDSWANLKKAQTLMGVMAVVEGNVRVRLDNDEIETFDVNDMYLGDPENRLKTLTQKPIASAYTPWEEMEENIKYKLEKKAKEKEQAAKLIVDAPDDLAHPDTNA